MPTPLERAVARATDTRTILVGDGVLDRTGAVVAALLPGRRAVVVADGTTWSVAGRGMRRRRWSRDLCEVIPNSQVRRADSCR